MNKISTFSILKVPCEDLKTVEKCFLCKTSVSLFLVHMYMHELMQFTVLVVIRSFSTDKSCWQQYAMKCRSEPRKRRRLLVSKHDARGANHQRFKSQPCKQKIVTKKYICLNVRTNSFDLKQEIKAIIIQSAMMDLVFIFPLMRVGQYASSIHADRYLPLPISSSVKSQAWQTSAGRV